MFHLTRVGVAWPRDPTRLFVSPLYPITVTISITTITTTALQNRQIDPIPIFLFQFLRSSSCLHPQNGALHANLPHNNPLPALLRETILQALHLYPLRSRRFEEPLLYFLKASHHRLFHRQIGVARARPPAQYQPHWRSIQMPSEVCLLSRVGGK